MTLQPLPLLVVALAFVQGLFSVGTVCTDQSLNASLHDHKDPGELPVVAPSAVVVAAALVIIAVPTLFLLSFIFEQESLRRHLLPSSKELLRLFFLGLTGVALTMLCTSFAFDLSSSSSSSTASSSSSSFSSSSATTTIMTLMMLLPAETLFTVVLALIFRREKVSVGTGLGLLCTIGGALVLAEVWRLDVFSSSSSSMESGSQLATVLLLASRALFFACFILFQKDMLLPSTSSASLQRRQRNEEQQGGHDEVEVEGREEKEKNEGWSPLVLNAYCFLFGGTIVVAVALLFEHERVEELAWVPWSTGACIAYVAVMPTSIGLALLTWAIGQIGASRVSAFLCLQPLLVTALMFFFVGEPLQGTDAIGAVFILLGLFLVSWRAKPSRAKDEAEEGEEEEMGLFSSYHRFLGLDAYFADEVEEGRGSEEEEEDGHEENKRKKKRTASKEEFEMIELGS